MTGRRSRRRMSSGATSTIVAPGAKRFANRHKGVELVDDRTVRFHFKQPFLDFPILLGTGNVCGAGWVVPAKYYEQTGPAGFLQKPVGLAPTGWFRSSQACGSSSRRSRLLPSGSRQAARRWSACRRRRRASPCWSAARRTSSISSRRADRPGEEQPKLRLAPVLSGNWWLQFPGFQNPNSPFHDKRVRQAISLARSRCHKPGRIGGMGVVDGNWINNDVQYGIEWPEWPRDVDKAKQLMAEAGYPERLRRRLGDAGARVLLAGRAHRRRSCRRSASAPGCRPWSAASI